MYGQAIKNPSILQNISQLSSGYPFLVPALIQTIEANYIFTLKNSLMFNVSLFKNMLNNLIVKRNIFNTVDNTWVLYSSNSGKMATHGIEISLDIKPYYNLRLKLSGMFQQSRNLEQGFSNIALGYSPNLLLYFNSIYFATKNLSFSLNGRYIGSMKTAWDDSPTDPENGDFTPLGRIGYEIPPYFVLDFNLRYNNFFRKNIFLNLHIFNISNREIRFPTTTSNAWADKGTLDFGRTVLFTVGTKLNN